MEKTTSDNKDVKKGDKLFYKGKVKEAMQHYEQATKDEPGNAVAWNNLGMCFVMFRKLDKSVECYNKAISINPKYFVAVRNKKKALKRLGKKKSPREESVEKIKSRGDHFLQSKEWDKALKFYNHLLLENEKDAQAWMGKGHTLLRKGFPNPAQKALERAKELDQALKKDPEFTKLWNESLGHRQEKTEAYRKKGDELTRSKDFEKAIQFYQLATKENPTAAKSWNNMGVAYVNLYLYKKALLYFDKALEIDPDYQQAKLNRDKCIKRFTEHRSRLKDAGSKPVKQNRLAASWKGTGVVDIAKAFAYIICGHCHKKFKIRSKECGQETKVICPLCDEIGMVVLKKV